MDIDELCEYQKGDWELDSSGDGKEVYVIGPVQMAIAIDYDDVDHEAVAKEVKQLIDLLAEKFQA